MALQKVYEVLRSTQAFSEVTKAAESHNTNTVNLEHFAGSTDALAAKVLQDCASFLLVVTPEHESAQFFKADLEAMGISDSLIFPPTNHKPYDNNQIIDTNLLVERAEIVEQLQKKEHKILVSSAHALFEKVSSPEEFGEASFVLEKGDEIDQDNLRERLIDQGYESCRFVGEPGEFATRGGIFDIYPFSGEYPVRLEFFGDEVDSIREFDPDSQRSVAFLDKARFVPNAQTFSQKNNRSLLEYLPENTIVLEKNSSLIEAELQKRLEEAEKTYEHYTDGTEKPKDADKKIHSKFSEAEGDGLNQTQPAPEFLFVGPDNYEHSLASYTRFHVGSFTKKRNVDATISLDAKPQPDFNGSFKLLRQNIQDLSRQGYDTYILCDNNGQRERFHELLGEPSKELRYHLSIETIHQGFIHPESGISVYTDHQIFNRYHRPKTRKRKVSGGISFKELRDLNVGDYVVHVDHGIGKFAGFQKINVRNIEQEAVKLIYKNDSVLYVNVSSLHKLQKYSGKEGAQPRITKLGSGSWARKKAKTKKRVKDIARDLIKLYAKRKSQTAYAFGPDTSWQTEMEANFEFEETPDQAKAIEATKQDMESKHPMDRLICGDVGFGKTEVAVRAAFKAVMDHKQVAMLVPTTILADQHYKTFSKRMSQFPVTVEVLSRFRSRAEQKEILKKTEAGKVDVLIGTHRITSKDVKFKNLGLLIVDEEQRFGVAAKDKLKEFRATVDVLTMTATPIPRTLQFSLMGARDLSIINTPPPNRQPVYTEIHSFDQELIRDAVLQEISRGGQVFFIHNRVKNIEQVAELVRSLAPDIRVRFAHGQMTSKQLEKIIADFYTHKFDVLVSTNIVENGIDISNANTIIINRADRFGLAELHQLRGRVGRSNRKAYCYLLTKPLNKLTNEARKRLMALEEFSDLGAGFNIAMRDLDIRGAGDILGAEQSGYINDIGFQLYTKILNDAVKELKEEEFSDVFNEVKIEIERPETTVEFDRPALLDKTYVSDNVERLNLYRKLAEANSEEEINDWVEEVEDRFGPLPEAGKNLVTAAQIKLYASSNFITKVTIRADRIWLLCPKNESELGKEFYEEGRFEELMNYLEKNRPERYEVAQKNNRVRLIVEDIADIEEASRFLKELHQPIPEAALV